MNILTPGFGVFRIPVDTHYVRGFRDLFMHFSHMLITSYTKSTTKLNHEATATTAGSVTIPSSTRGYKSNSAMLEINKMDLIIFILFTSFYFPIC